MWLRCIALAWIVWRVAVPVQACSVTCCQAPLTCCEADLSASQYSGLSFGTVQSSNISTTLFPGLSANMKLYAGFCNTGLSDTIYCGYGYSFKNGGATTPNVQAEAWTIGALASDDCSVTGWSAFTTASSKPGTASTVPTPPRLMCIGLPFVATNGFPLQPGFFGIGANCVYQTQNAATACSSNGNLDLVAVTYNSAHNPVANIGGVSLSTPPYWCLANDEQYAYDADFGPCKRYSGAGNCLSTIHFAGGQSNFVEQQSAGVYVWSGSQLGYDCYQAYLIPNQYAGCYCNNGWFGAICETAVSTYCGSPECSGFGTCNTNGGTYMDGASATEGTDNFCTNLLALNKDVNGQVSFCTCNANHFGPTCEITCQNVCPANSQCVTNGLVFTTYDVNGNIYHNSDNCGYTGTAATSHGGYGPGCCTMSIDTSACTHYGYCAHTYETVPNVVVTPTSAICVCNTHWFTRQSNKASDGSATECITCMSDGSVDGKDGFGNPTGSVAIPTCNNNGVCVNQPLLGQDVYRCLCKPGFGGFGCEVEISLQVTCGNQASHCGNTAINIECIAQQYDPNNPTQQLSASAITYQCAYLGTLNTCSEYIPGLATSAYQLQFVCSNINLYATGTTTLDTQANMCTKIKTACQSQLLQIPPVSNDLCPLPFIDQLPLTTGAFCNYPYTGPRTDPSHQPPQWLQGTYYTRTFYCYQLSSGLSITTNSSLTPYRCVHAPTETQYFLQCDLLLTRSQIATFISSPQSLAKRIFQFCNNVT